MQKNRFFKTTMGLFAELAIATQVDAADGTAAVGEASMVTLPITVAGSPTAGDILLLTFSNGKVVEYTVPVAGTTAIVDAGVKAAIEAVLADVPGASVGYTGTTSLVLTIGAGVGTAYNGVTITPSETGSTFTVAGAVTFAGGLDADATASDKIEDFVNNALGGSIWAFWNDTNLALKAGDTNLATNKNRAFYYAWKQADATIMHRSAAIPVNDFKYNSTTYNAGTVEIMTAAYTGTYSVGQILHLRIINTTPEQLPYASYDYAVTIGSGGINQAVTDLATAINAEASANTPIATAGGSTSTLTVTGILKSTTFKLASYLEVTTAQPSDLSVITFATTQKGKDAIGTVASVRELEQYSKVNRGGVNYGTNMVNADEFGDISTNIGTNGVTQFGFLLVTSNRTETGVVRNYANKAYILVAIKSTDVATLAAL